MNLRERIARTIAKERNPQFDPDTRVCSHIAESREGWKLLPPDEYTVPLWGTYLSTADIAIAALREELEAAGIAWPDETNSRTPDNPA